MLFKPIPTNAVKVKIPFNYQFILFSVITTSWVTGAAFYILSRWVTIEGEFGPEKHPWQFPILMIHGAAAFAMILSFGFMLVSHVSSAWKINRLRYLGISLITIISFQIISAYLLYYLANEEARLIISNLHAGAGFLFPFVLATHIIVGITTRKKRKTMVTKQEAYTN